MDLKTKLIYLDSMPQNDISEFLAPNEIKSYIEMRHRTRKSPYDETQRLSTRAVREDVQ